MRKIKNDIDALFMAQNVDSTEEVYVYVRIGGGANAGGFDEHENRDNACHVEQHGPEEVRDANSDLEGRLLNMEKTIIRNMMKRTMKYMTLSGVLVMTQMSKLDTLEQYIEKLFL